MSVRRCFIGTSGWVYPHWKGRFYPKDLSQKQWFAYYAERFDTVEINNTFYRLPSEDAVVQWRERAPDRFVYAVKASRFLSHIKRLRDVEEPLERFTERAVLLREHLGPILVQLPESFQRTPENLQRLHAFFSMLPPKIPFVMEYRHQSLFHEEVYDLMREQRVGLVVASDPKRPTDFVATSAVVYVRFHGSKGIRYQGNYPRAQLRQWAQRIEELADGRTTYIYFNNDYNAYAIRNAQTLRELLDGRPPAVRVRPFVLADLPRVLMIEQRSFPSREAYEKHQFEEFHRETPEGFAVAEVDGDVVGYVVVRARGERGEVVSVAVDPGLRRLGIGKLLIERAVNRLQSLGIRTCYLETRTDNTQALRLFRAFGFQLASEIKDYYAPGVDAYRLRLDLTAGRQSVSSHE